MLGSLFLRDQMPVTHHWLYLDHAAVAPLLKSTADAMAAWGTQVAQHGAANWGVWRRTVEAGRQLAANFVGAVPEEIAFIRNTTEGVALVAQGWNWSPGDSVVVPDSEFPSNLYPWMALAARGVDVRVVPGCGMLDGDEFCRQLLGAVDGSTRIVAVSWVDYSTGRRRPLD